MINRSEPIYEIFCYKQMPTSIFYLNQHIYQGAYLGNYTVFSINVLCLFVLQC